MEEQKIDRREFIKRTSRAGAAIAVTGGLTGLLYINTERVKKNEATVLMRNYRVPIPKDKPVMAIVKGGAPEALTKAAINALGGIETFISRGDIVVLKPNIGWDRVQEQAANTNPEIVKTLAMLCLNAGAKKVIVSDVSCNDPQRCFTRSGIAKAAESVGAVVLLPEERKFKNFKINGELLTVWPIYTPIIEADKIINIPIVKHHNLARATLGMKNLYGIVGGNRNQLHQNLDICIADLATFLKPTLTVLDAYRILTANGPQGGNLSDVKLCKIVAASTDPVAIDAYGATLLGLKAEDIPCIGIGYKRGLGNKNYLEVPTANINIE
jgi:uncharacterized protein (DUF362 family)